MKADTIRANLGEIIARVSKLDRQSRQDERTDIDEVWGALYDIRDSARHALKVHERRQLLAFHCTVDYRTKGGRCSTWSGTVLATDIDEASDYARKRIARRKSTLKIDGGSAQLIPTGAAT